MPELIKRSVFLERINEEFQVHPVVAILGPRQCGKTTISKQYIETIKTLTSWFDLENPNDLSKLNEPMLALENLQGLIVIDEIQRREDLFPILRVLVDQDKEKKISRKFLILGSASPNLIKQSSESLAGRIGYIELPPFTLEEIKYSKQRTHWIRGGFPESYLSENDENSYKWRNAFISTFLERDIPNLGINISARTLRRFWTMLAHYHGQVINYSQIANSIQASDTAIRRYLDILENTYMVKVLAPWFENIKKRQVKSPKIYIRDSGILHSLLGLNSENQVLGHPKCGSSWEGYCLEQITNLANEKQSYFWATHAGAELDLLMLNGAKKLGFEFKFSSQPKVTKSLKLAKETLGLDEITIVTPGSEAYQLSKGIKVSGISKILQSDPSQG